MAKSKPLRPLKSNVLLSCCAGDLPEFETTDDLDPLTGTVGQARALEALEVGLGIRREGYNIFVLGYPGVGKHTLVRKMLAARAATEPSPSDWCYVHNFDEPHEPRALELPPGVGLRLRASMTAFVDELKKALPTAFASDTFQARIRKANEEMQSVQDQAFEAVAELSTSKGVAMGRTEEGFTFAPLSPDGDGVIEEEDFLKLPEKVQKTYEKALNEMQDKLNVVISSVPRWQREARDKVMALRDGVTAAEVDKAMEPLRVAFADRPKLTAFLDIVRTDVITHVHLFQEPDPEDGLPVPGQQMGPTQPVNLSRYAVSVLCDHSKTEGAPVVFADNPALAMLVGKIEHRSEFGVLSTDHTLIKPGAFHQANGGYLLLDARKVLGEQHAWTEMKRILRARKVRMDSPGSRTNLMTTVSLTPEPIPVDVKVILLGDPAVYYELSAQDPDFERYFKIVAAFEEHIPRSRDNVQSYARMIATKAKEEGLRPFDRGAVARIIEHASRRVEDAEKLSANLSHLFNLLDEADYWASRAERKVVTEADVDEALAAWVRRMSQPRDRLRQALERGTLLVDTDGVAVGQINGLAVISMGDFAFGRPSRITATARTGYGNLVDIERESHLAGGLHRKGVLILSALLRSRYAREAPLSLSASLVFEQSYGTIDGDSASLAELCALLSAISDIPIKQSIAVTGSINQRGMVQAIGGVNAKIEGFFDLCNQRGLTGEQGVIVPSSNVKNLMLRRDVVKAVSKKRFNVWAAETVDQAIAILTGVPAGQRNAKGEFPKKSVNATVEARLLGFVDHRRQYAASVRELSEG